MNTIKSDNKQLGVSIVICVYNGANRLPQTLMHIAKQRTGLVPWEVIVVDNCSSDNSSQVVGNVWPSKLQHKMRILEESRLGKSYALIRGFQAAKYSGQ